MPPLVSVVVPCFNQARYLGEAIDSALCQAYPLVEILVVDDGSTDDTGRVAAAFPGVTCLRQPNAGTAAARNHGLQASRGAIVIFLDADDRLRPGAVARGVDYLERHPEAAFVSGHVRLVHADGAPDVVPVHDHGPAGYESLLRANYIWTPGIVAYRRAVLEALGGFDAGAGGSADYDLNIRIARDHAIGCHHEVVLDYRQHDANMTRNAAYMLASAVAVRRRERAHAVARGAEDAWRSGLRGVRADFGARVVDRIKGDLVAGRRASALRGLICLLRHHPVGLAAMAAPREWPKLAARRWRAAPR
jgi:glycosyltransferase involved in cell wall biosynthesis